MWGTRNLTIEPVMSTLRNIDWIFVYLPQQFILSFHCHNRGHEILSSSISPSIVVVVVHVIDLLSFNLSIIFLLPKCISIWYWFIISLSNKSHTHFETHRFIYFIFSFILGRAFTQNLFSFYFSIHQSDDVVCCIKGLTKSVCWWWCKIKKRKKKLADAINKANNQISIHLSSYRCSAALLWNAAIFFSLFSGISTH